MVYVQLSGDESVLDEYRPYITGPWSFHEHTPPDLKLRLSKRSFPFWKILTPAAASPHPLRPNPCSAR